MREKPRQSGEYASQRTSEVAPPPTSRRAPGVEPRLGSRPSEVELLAAINKTPPKDRFAHLSREERAGLKELAEIERAIAALEGRADASPEDVAFARKEAERMRQGLAATIEKAKVSLRAQRRTKLVRLAVAVMAIGAAVAAVVAALPVARAKLAARAAATRAADVAAAPFLDEGFAVIEAGSGAEPRVVHGERGRCFVAVAGASGGAARVRLARGVMSAEGPSAGLCACGAEPIRISAEGDGPIELRVLAADASLAGGADLLGSLPAPPAARLAEEVDRACAEEAIDSFVAAATRAPTARGELPPPDEARAVSLGFQRVAVAPPGRPLAAIPAAKEACFLALSDGEGDALSLRLHGGERPLVGQRAPLAFCAASLEGASVWRDGAGTLRVFSMPAARAGGLLGMRELAERLGRPAALWIAGGDLALDARAALVASSLAPRTAGEAGEAGARAAAAAAVSFVAVSADERSLFAIEPGAPDVLCRPGARQQAERTTRALCLLTRAGALGDPARLPSFVATAPRPQWLPVSAQSRAQNARMLDVLAFARRLTAAGFELATLTGFREVPGGVEISARSGEKEIVALAVSLAPPFLHPLTDGPAWTIEGEPRIVPLAAGATVKLAPEPRYVGPSAVRETLVWRR